jgi:hypothetical protein
MTGAIQVYQSCPLSPDHPQIRLLTLQPGTWSDEICCNVRVASFDKHLEYECLSYVWGDPEVRKTINLEGYRFEATENLWLAMRRLRQPESARVFWIDAICINQADKHEKSQQVAMMGDIYKNCQKCTIWLGEDNETGEGTSTSTTAVMACELLDMLGNDRHLHEMPCFSIIEGRRAEISKTYDDHFEALRRFLSLPWWKRTWIIQELALPKTVQFLFASKEIPYQALSSVVHMLETHATSCCRGNRTSLRALAFDQLLLIQEQVEPLVSTRETWTHGEKVTLFQLRRRFYSFQATEKRDLFYGLLGLVTHWNSSPLQPRYDISLREAIAGAVFKCIKEEGRLDFLLGERFLRDSTDMPTWVPDASFSSVQSQWVTVEQRRLNLATSFSASASYTQAASEFTMVGHETLLLQTLMVDRISQLGPVFDALEKWQEAPDVLRQWMDMLKIGVDWPEKAPAEGSREDIFWKTLINNCFEMDTAGLSYRAATEEDYSELLKLWGLLKSFAPFLAQFAINDASHDILQSAGSTIVYHILVCLWQRRLFVTERGMIGLAPLNASVGDEVHIVPGASMPFIFRPYGDSFPSVHSPEPLPAYTVVGYGYVHEIMFGEAFKDNGGRVIKTVALY